MVRYFPGSNIGAVCAGTGERAGPDADGDGDTSAVVTAGLADQPQVMGFCNEAGGPLARLGSGGCGYWFR
jgi:hypothetical protein